MHSASPKPTPPTQPGRPFCRGIGAPSLRCFSYLTNLPQESAQRIGPTHTHTHPTTTHTPTHTPPHTDTTAHTTTYAYTQTEGPAAAGTPNPLPLACPVRKPPMVFVWQPYIRPSYTPTL